MYFTQHCASVARSRAQSRPIVETAPQTNGRIATNLAHDGSNWACVQDVLNVKVEVKVHMIRALL